MNRTIFAATLIAVALPSSFASAAVLTKYTFESVTLATTASASPVATVGSLNADVGTGAFTGVHASTASLWTTPAGNGSTKSVAGDHWAIGDYWQFTADTTGVTGVKLQFDSVGSGTGPRDFKVQYSTTGTAGPFTDLTGGTYSLDTTSFSTATVKTTTPPRFNFDLSSISGLDNNANAAFRLVDTSTVSTNAGTVGTGGTNRVDNISVGLVPEPTTLAALGGVFTLALRRRKA